MDTHSKVLHSTTPNKGVVEYTIENVDYFENDAFLVLNGIKFYFQWDASNPPTLEDALNFLQQELKV